MNIILIVFVLFGLLSGCASPGIDYTSENETDISQEREETTPKPNEKDSSDNESTVDLPPVETAPPESDYLPAFEGQTRIDGMKTRVETEVSVLTEELNQPWGIVTAPDGRFFVTEKQGALRIVSASGEVSPPVSGFPALQTQGQGGLLDLALSPDFLQDRLIYFTLAEQTDQGSVTAVGQARLAEDETELIDFTVIFRALPYYEGSAHFGSRLIFASDGSLFVTTGDRQSDDTRMRAQTLDNGYGKVLHIDRTGRAIDDHFPDQTDAWTEIYSYGHRNIQGIAIHPETGDIWISEMGPRGGDELNLILPGKNYGWPLVSYGIEYSGARVLEGITQLEDTEQPVYYWDPVVAPSGMVFYDSDVIAEWKNQLFIAGLRGSHVVRLMLENNRVIGEERLLQDMGERYRDLSVGMDGALYAVTDSGKMYRLGLKQ